MYLKHQIINIKPNITSVFCNFQDSLEGVLVATHQEMELYRNQPHAMEKLQLKKESLQNKLINIRGELSQASSVRNQTIEQLYENTLAHNQS